MVAKTISGGGLEWHERQGTGKNQWLAVVEDGGLPPRIKRLDDVTYACYRDGKYLGSERTLDKAFARIKSNVQSDRNIELALWIRHHPGELPPGLDLTAAERAEYWRHNPPRAAPARSVTGRGSRQGEDPATSRLRAELAAEGGAGGKAKGRRSSRLSDGSEPSEAGVIRVKGGALVPKKPGSAAHGRWVLLWSHDGRTVGDYRRSKGNMTTLANAMAKGFVTVEEG